MQYRMVSLEEIDLLVEQRLRFIEIDKSDRDYSEIRKNCYEYFKKALAQNSCDVVFAEENGRIIGTGIVFYYNSVPSKSNVTGRNAYITSMFVEPNYRHQGIGTAILKKIIEVADTKGYSTVMLNASEMGKTMYRKCGFVEINNGMIWKK